MRRILNIILCFLVLQASACIAQTNDDFFVLGTFSNYGGRYYIDTAACEVDYYYPYEKSFARYMRRSIARHYGQVKLRHIEQRYRLYSCPQFKVIDSLYLASDELENDNIFETKEQVLSYLHGVYLHFGYSVNDTVYYIKVANSQHGRLFYKVAQLNGFTDIKIEEFETIPHYTVVFFKPTPEFLDVIRPTKKIKTKLIKAEEKLYKKIFNKEVYDAYIEAKRNITF